jgi:hypothetical protein
MVAKLILFGVTRSVSDPLQLNRAGLIPLSITHRMSKCAKYIKHPVTCQFSGRLNYAEISSKYPDKHHINPKRTGCDVCQDV